MPQKAAPKNGCGCLNIPIFFILLILGGGYWWLIDLGNANAMLSAVSADPLWESSEDWISKVSSGKISFDQSSSDIPNNPPSLPEPTFTPPIPNLHGTVAENSYPAPQAPADPAPKTTLETPPLANSTIAPVVAPPTPNSPSAAPNLSPSKPPQRVAAKTPWEQKQIRGIYLSRYQVTNNASEQVIRDRVRYYKRQGFNTLIHGVWGNGCTMYNSQVMQKNLGFKSCPNLFEDQWLNWMIDEAHRQEMEVHAYFEKGIKLDQNSPTFDRAVAKNWLVPGIDKTYAGIDHYVLDVEVAAFFRAIATEFVQKYPEIDAIQWDDYLGYHAELPGQVDRTAALTAFTKSMVADVKKANSQVSFDLCHHNPYWAKRYFAADWEQWPVDRVFIQVYNDANFEDELDYIRQYDGVAIADNQLHRLKQVAADSTVKNILIFPMDGKPEQTAERVQKALKK